MELTSYERKTLEILKAAGAYMTPSQIGYALFEAATPGRKANPSAQGMALAAGRHIGSLKQRGMLYNSTNGWAISKKGLDALNEASASLF